MTHLHDTHAPSRETSSSRPSSTLRSAAGLTLALAACLASATASAQMSTGELQRAPQSAGSVGSAGWLGSHVVAELGVYSERGLSPSYLPYTIHVFAPSVYGTVRLAELAPSLELGVDFGMRAVAIDGTVRASSFGNGYLGAHVGLLGASHRARIGVGVGLPFVSAYPDALTGDLLAGNRWAALERTRAMGGYWDAYYASDASLPVVVRGDFEWRDALFFAGVDGGLALYVPTEGGDGALSLQLGGFAGVRPFEGLAVGVRGQSVYLHAFEQRVAVAVDEAQLAVVPFVRGELAPGFVEARFLVNVDEPSTRVAPWSLTFLGGADF